MVVRKYMSLMCGFARIFERLKEGQKSEAKIDASHVSEADSMLLLLRDEAFLDVCDQILRIQVPNSTGIFSNHSEEVDRCFDKSKANVA